jgi:hypothetical protein
MIGRCLRLPEGIFRPIGSALRWNRFSSGGPMEGPNTLSNFSSHGSTFYG